MGSTHPDRKDALCLETSGARGPSPTSLAYKNHRGRYPWSRLSREGVYGKRESQRLSLFLRHGLADGFAVGNLLHGTGGTVHGESPRGPLGIFGSALHAIWFAIHGEEGPVGSRLGSRGCGGRGCDARPREFILLLSCSYHTCFCR